MPSSSTDPGAVGTRRSVGEVRTLRSRTLHSRTLRSGTLRSRTLHTVRTLAAGAVAGAVLGTSAGLLTPWPAPTSAVLTSQATLTAEVTVTSAFP